MSDQRGLTLLELLIALGLVGLVGVIAVLSLRLASHAWERGEAKLDTAQRVRFVTDLLTRELSSALPYMARLSPDEQMVAFIGQAAAVKFMTATGGLALTVPEGAVREVTYAFGPGGLYRAEAPASDRHFAELGRGVAVPIEAAVAQFQLRYLHRTTGTWQDSWSPKVVSMKQRKPEEEADSADLFPAAVAVQLTLEGPEGREEHLPPLIIPIASEFPPEPKPGSGVDRARPTGKEKRR